MTKMARASTPLQTTTLRLRRALRLDMGCQLRCHPRHLTMIQNYAVRRQKPLKSTTLIVTNSHTSASIDLTLSAFSGIWARTHDMPAKRELVAKATRLPWPL
ncbi:hypothetical protein TNCV_2243991 [Trichonephila clavipes]|nr:hypothetical protein TNCV_2243991 [Trichonephila clavipes]